MDLFNLLKDLSILVLFPVGRSVSGWAVNALDDSKITEFEWQQLFQTVLRVGTLGLVGFFGLSSLGVDNAALVAAVCSFVVDKVLNSLKKLKK